MIMQTFYVNHRIEFYLINTINPRVNCTHAMLYPQNGDHIVAIDSVTSFHPVYWHCYHTVRNMVYETVWLSVSPSRHLAAIPAAAAILLLCVRRAGDITCVLHGRCSAANVSRVKLQGDAGSWTHTCLGSINCECEQCWPINILMWEQNAILGSETINHNNTIVHITLSIG